MTDPTAMQTDVAILKRDVERMNEFFGKLDTAIEKISDLSNSITRMLAVHDERLDKQEATSTEIFRVMEETNTATGKELRDLYLKMSDITNQMNQTLSDLRSHVIDQLSKKEEEARKERAALAKRIVTLEKWRWVLFGGGVILYGLMTYLGPTVFDHIWKKAP
jgi:ABC-type transporter Mla subunit MlaD